MAIYVTMNIGTFAFILMMEQDGSPSLIFGAQPCIREARTGKALAMLVLLFSLAGVPPMLGFFASSVSGKRRGRGARVVGCRQRCSPLPSGPIITCGSFSLCTSAKKAPRRNGSKTAVGFLDGLRPLSVCMGPGINMFGIERIAELAAATSW